MRETGNSSRVIIPKPLLAEMGARADDDVEGGQIVISPVRHTREGWAAARELAETGGDALMWPEFANHGMTR